MEIADAPLPSSDAVASSETEDGITTLSVEEAIRKSAPKRRAPKLRKGGTTTSEAPPLEVEKILARADAWRVWKERTSQ